MIRDCSSPATSTLGSLVVQNEPETLSDMLGLGSFSFGVLTIVSDDEEGSGGDIEDADTHDDCDWAGVHGSLSFLSSRTEDESDDRPNPLLNPSDSSDSRDSSDAGYAESTRRFQPQASTGLLQPRHDDETETIRRALSMVDRKSTVLDHHVEAARSFQALGDIAEPVRDAMPSPIVLGAVTMAESEPDQRIVEALTVPSPPSRRDQRLWVPVEVVHEDVVYRAFFRHDSGAQKSFVSEKFVNRLGLNSQRRIHYRWS